MSDNKINELINHGKKTGRLYTQEITNVIEELDFDADQINKLYEEFENLNIEVVDNTQMDDDLDSVLKFADSYDGDSDYTVDGIVIDGKASVDTSALTGESVPRELQEGDNAISGCINTNGILRIKVEKEYTDSTVSKILELVEHAGSKKTKTENFITRFAKIYTPVVVAGAVLLAVIPPLVTGASFEVWFERALTFLVISCPCALVISVPLGFFAGIGSASKAGILIKGSCYLEALSKPYAIAFDKTGTLTKGSFEVQKIIPQ